MPEYLHPGVYIEEIERGPKPIEGVPTSTAAFLGEAERGPTDAAPRHQLQGLPALVRRRVRRRQVPAVRRERLLRERRQAPVRLPRRRDDAATPAQAGVRRLHRPGRGPGRWGKRVFVRIEDSSTKKAGQRQPVPSVFACGSPTGPRTPAGRSVRARSTRPNSSPLPPYFEDFDDLVTDEASPDFYGKRLRRQLGTGRS